MAEFLNKAVIPAAIEEQHDFDNSCNVIMTEDFFQINVPYATEVVPNQSINGVIKGFGRNTPMFKPTLGSAQHKLRKFFVPFRVVWPIFSQFIENAPQTNDQGTSIPTNVPLVTTNALNELFFGAAPAGYHQLSTQLSSSATVFDFSHIGVKFNLTSYGRQVLKILNALGYKLFPKSKADADASFTYSMLPILSLAKVFVDWYWPAQYSQSGHAATINGFFNRHFSYTIDSSDNNEMLRLRSIFEVICYAYYDNDLFTSAFDSPVAPTQSAYSSLSIVDVTNNAVSVVQHVFNDPDDATSPNANALKPQNGTPFVGSIEPSGISSGRGAQGAFTQYIDTALHLLTDYMRRNAIAGSRALERYLLEWGVKLDSEQLMRSRYLGQSVTPWQIGDVMANSDTFDSSNNDGARLGDYAGKGVSYENGLNIDFEPQKEFGYFLVVKNITPDISYVQGVDRFTLHKTLFDFFHPTFDALGVQGISRVELMTTKYGDNDWAKQIDNVFGFSSRYYEYKVGHLRDRLCGDFVLDSINVGLMPWSTARMFADSNALVASNYSHSLAFMSSNDRLQYDRVFYGYDANTLDNNVDNFYFVYRISCKMSMPMKPFYDTYDFIDADKKSRITIEGHGVRMS